MSDGVCGAILIHHHHLVHPGEEAPVVQHGNRTTVQAPPVPMEQDKFLKTFSRNKIVVGGKNIRY